MPKLSQLLNRTVEQSYLLMAEEQLPDYLILTENENLPSEDKQVATDIVFELTRRHGVYEGEKLLPESMSVIQSHFSKVFELHNLHLKLFELLLCVIEKQLGITAPEVSRTCQIKQDIPLLRPDDFLMSRLQASVYELIENETELAKYLDAPKKYQAILTLWLVLKEGINKEKVIKSLLDKSSDIYRINQHWFIDSKFRRYWLSPMAELLLIAYWNDNQVATKNIMGQVNQYFHDHRIMPSRFIMRFGDIRAMMKNEFILTLSAIEFSICQSTLRTTSLPQSSLYRLLSGLKVAQIEDDYTQRTMTTRQKVAWLSACSSSAEQLRKKTSVLQMEMTTAEQITLVDRFTSVLIKTSLKESVRINNELQNELRNWLELNDNAKAYPWVWMVLSWLYNLLRHGGKYKKRLRLTTIKAYISYVASPFIQEFSGCAPKKMEGLDWGEKLNIVAEHITSTKKAYVLYFAEFLIESELVPDLCLSDIDIPAVEHKVSANLITQREADSIILACDKLNTPVSKLSKLCFYFGFYSGLRRGEVSGLQFADFTMNGTDYANLHVRPNKYRELKSSESSRNLPLDCLWPKQYLSELSDYLRVTKTKFTQAKSLIFSSPEQLNEAFSLLTQLMKIVTGEPNIRFHHCRHSFCNWTWLRLNYSDPVQLADFDFCQHDFFSPINHDRLCRRLMLAPFSRKKWWALSGVLGHSSPEVTTSSYFHLAELLQRTRFSHHTPSPFLLRKFWGQQLRLDDFGRLKVIPQSRSDCVDVYPTNYLPVLDDTNIDAAIELICQETKVKLKNQVTLRNVWEIICFAAEGYAVNDIALGFNIEPARVSSVLKQDELITQTTLKRSKHHLMPLVNYHKLHRGNTKALEEMVACFEKAEQSSAIPNDFNFETMNEVLNDLVGAKDSLIRTHNKNAALWLLRLLQLMGYTEEDLRIQWYFPSEKQFEIEKLDRYREHLKFWKETINQRLFKDMELEIIVPINLYHHIRTSKYFKLIQSDTGKYLKYYPPGTISIHFVQSKFNRTRFDTHGTQIVVPQRTRAFVSFLRLIAIYTKLKSH